MTLLSLHFTACNDDEAINTVQVSHSMICMIQLCFSLCRAWRSGHENNENTQLALVLTWPYWALLGLTEHALMLRIGYFSYDPMLIKDFAHSAMGLNDNGA